MFTNTTCRRDTWSRHFSSQVSKAIVVCSIRLRKGLDNNPSPKGSLEWRRMDPCLGSNSHWGRWIWMDLIMSFTLLIGLPLSRGCTCWLLLSSTTWNKWCVGGLSDFVAKGQSSHLAGILSPHPTPSLLQSNLLYWRENWIILENYIGELIASGPKPTIKI